MKPLRFLFLVCLFLASCVSSRVKVAKEAVPRQRQWAEVCRECAMLSYAVYHPAGAKPADKRQEQEEHALASHFRSELMKEGWQCVLAHGENRDRDGIHPGKWVDGQGLYFEIWTNRRSQPVQHIIAFRGTNFGQLSDWASNFRWFRRINTLRKPDQYDTARDLCREWLKKNVPPGRPDRIVTTGHSLGGGLAQYIFYSSAPRADQAIVFDPSPVTGFHDREIKDGARAAKEMEYRPSFVSYRIIRAYEDGEILQYVRNALDPLVPDEPLIRHIEFKSKHRSNTISQHSMSMLACTILELTGRPQSQFVREWR